MTEDPSNWELPLQAARALTDAGQTPFTRLNVYQWIWQRYPRQDHDRPSLDPTFQGMIKNPPGGPPSSCVPATGHGANRHAPLRASAQVA